MAVSIGTAPPPEMSQPLGIEVESVQCPIDKTSDYRTDYQMPELAARVGVGERVVEGVEVAVEVLRVVGHLDVGVGRQEASQYRVVKTRVHVIQPEPRQPFVAGEAPPQQQVRHSTVAVKLLRRRVAQPPPCVVAVLRHQVAFTVGNVRDAPQVVSADEVQLPHRHQIADMSCLRRHKS